MTRRPASALGVVVAALLVGGCGGPPGPADVVRQAVGSPGASRCELYTDSFFERQAGVTAAAGRASCRQVARTLPVIRVQISQVSVRGDTAQVTAQASGRVVVYRLVRVGGRWLIDSLG